MIRYLTLALALAFAFVFTLRTVAAQNKAELPDHLLGSYCVEGDDESNDWDELLLPQGQCRNHNGSVYFGQTGLSGPGRGNCEFNKIERIAPDVYLIHANCAKQGLSSWTLNFELARVEGELHLTYRQPANPR